ncbi:MAG: FG-GAP-like repeat-containing protein [Reichenbachiella sp.]|uniref:FG-GAP-like repeat-containing protein n=1 Tax=Reichenbachiella sp. TaxID=2184521 RepID=UPI00326503E0
MKTNNHFQFKHCISVLLIFVSLISARAQAPYINSVTPAFASAGETVNIAGTNLTGVSIVYFGGAQGSNVTVVNDNLITAEVPFGASFNQISALHTSNGSAFSIEKFYLSFDGASIADGSTVISNLSSQETFATSNTQTQDLCACDFDNDGQLDLAVSNAGSTEISIFSNTSTLGDADFSSSSISNSFPVTNVICGDLDGDGFPDLIANELGGEGKIYTYRNNQAGGFDTKETYAIPKNGSLFRKPGRIALGDLDLDGFAEVIVNVEDDNIVYYFENNSTNGDIDLASSPESLSSTENAGSAGLGGIDVADLNNDGFPEIITSNFTEQGFYVFQNNSQPGSFTFKDPIFTNTNSNIRALKVGDMNQDGYLDVILTNSDISSSDIIEISENTTSGTGQAISMDAPIQILGINTSWGLDLGDIDGDGDLDIAVGSFGSNNGFYVVMNTNPSSIAAASYSVGLIAESNADNSRNIKIVDIDSDGRPDFVYTNNSTAEGNGNLATRLNEICFEPVIRPSGPVVLCTGETVDLVAPASGYSYVWELDGVVDGGQTTNTFAGISTAGSYTVTVSDNAGCNVESAAIEITTPAETYDAPTFVISDDSPCEGDNVTFTVTADADTDSYLWTGPNGYSSTDENPTINDFQVNQSGEYYVTTTSNGAGCQKSSASSAVSTIGLPVVTVNNSNPDFFCTGESLDLSTNEFTGYTYDWKLDGASFSPAETDPSQLTATAEGDYSVTISGSGCSSTSEARSITTVAPPTSIFSASDDITCEGVAIDFTAGSTGASGLAVVNNWDYTDGSDVEVGDLVNHAFSSAGSYDVSLTAKYDGIDDADCTYTPVTSSITIVAPPSGTDLDLIISDNSDPLSFEKCDGVALTLRVEDLYPAYEWKSGTTPISTISIANVTDPQEVFVTLTNDDDCVFDSNPVTVSNYTTGGIQISASSPNTVIDNPNDDTKNLLESLGKYIDLEDGQTSINLDVVDATEPAWEPSLYINDTTLTSVVVTVANKQLITVYGTDPLGCQEKDTVTLIVPGIQGAKHFTPNGDGINDCWEVSNIGFASSDCQVVIFDAKGRRIREISFGANSNEEDCVWDGNQSNGSSLPNGMYYYFISCADSGEGSSGSIFMAR